MPVLIPETQLGTVLIPSFTVSRGNIVVIKLPHGALFSWLTSSFADHIKRQTSDIAPAFAYVDYSPGTSLKRLFSPVSIKDYVHKAGNPSSPAIAEMYKSTEFSPGTKLSSLISGDQKLLALLVTLSRTPHVILNMSGLDPERAKRIFSILQDNASRQGTSIILDLCDEFKSECTHFIESMVITV